MGRATACVLLLLVLGGCSAHTTRPWMTDPSDPPAARAAKVLAEMQLEEKVAMLHGFDPDSNDYVGNIAGNSRLGIPGIRMEDGPQGFRCDGQRPSGKTRGDCPPGSTTAWPSGLTIAASFDTEMARAWGAGMGEEFLAKGANVQLGPGMCLARVPTCGRNFEYLSGEDPILGHDMVAQAIRGIQQTGVIANAKHWVMNNQETNRHGVTEVVDERTMYELYYVPFEGAIKAGEV